MAILVTGGAGFIGSVVVEMLLDAGESVVVFDSLKAGHRLAVDPRATFVQGDLLNPADLDALFSSHRIEAVCHLAAEIAVGESVTDPGLHYRTNVIGSLNLADAMVRHGVKKIVFSSTAAVYGEPKQIPIPEDAETRPVNPYGETKLTFERALHWYGKAHGIRHVALRYFNACGASAAHGEYRDRETHLIPILLEVVLGQRQEFGLFGDDYPTHDGSCVRDFVHIADIAQAHILALDYLNEAESDVFNIGSGQQNSNREVLDMVRKVTGHPVPSTTKPRREGDPAVLLASNEKIRRVLGWEPKFPDLESMVQSAWDWRRQHPKGYGSESA